MSGLSSGPAKDAAYTALLSRTGVLERFTALDVSVGRLNVLELFVRGVPIEEYIGLTPQQEQDLTPRRYELQPQLDSVPRGLLYAPNPFETADSQNASSATTSPRHGDEQVEFAQVSSRAAHAHVSDITHGYHDPVNGKRGHVLTSDDYGQGSWSALPHFGDVEGPLQSRIDSLAVFDSKDGRLLRDSEIIVRDNVLCAPKIEAGTFSVSPVPSGAIGTVATLGSKGTVEWKDPLFNNPELQSWIQQHHSLKRTENANVKQVITLSPVGELIWDRTVSLSPEAIQPTTNRLVKFGAADGSIISSSCVSETEDGRVTIPHLTVETVTFAKNGIVLPDTVIGVAEDGKWELRTLPSPTNVSPTAVSWKDEIPTSKPYTVPMQINGQLLPSQVEIHRGSHLHCESVLTVNVTGDEVHANQGILKAITSRNAIIDEISSQHISVVDLCLPKDAGDGKILTSDKDGMVRWTDPPKQDSGPASSTKGAVPVFADETGKALANSMVLVSENGTATVNHLVVTQPEVALVDRMGSTLFSVTSGHSVKLGPFSGAGLESVSVGYRCQANLGGGQGNSGLGWKALESNVEGHHNTALGNQSLCCAVSSANTAVGSGSFLALLDGGHNTGVGTGCGEAIIHGSSNVALGDGAGPASDVDNTICIGRGARALNSGDLALGSKEAPLKLSHSATSGELSGLNPCAYLPLTLNGVTYKLALFHP